MIIGKRLLTASYLAKKGAVKIDGVCALNVGGLVKIDSDNPDKLKAALTLGDGTVLENPMTWDTFTHIFLLNKER